MSDAAPLSTALIAAFDHMIAEARAEIAEHEEHVALAKQRLAHIMAIRAVLKPNPEDAERHP